jgi:hypothetical protein
MIRAFLWSLAALVFLVILRTVINVGMELMRIFDYDRRK